MSAEWSISDGERIIYNSAAFDKTGWLKKQNEVILAKVLPATSGESICFTTIGYIVKAFINGQSIYSFGSSPDGSDVWGVKTHIIKIPDGGPGRMLRLEFSTNHPANIAVSKFVLLDDVLAITDTLLKSSLIEICFSLLYISIGVFILIYTGIFLAFRYKIFDVSLLMVALIALLMGCRILFNIPFVTLYQGPEFVYWSVNLLNLAIPVPALLFVAADKGFARSRLLVVTAAVQSIFLLLWIICQSLNLNVLLLYWSIPLFILTAAVFIVTFAMEFLQGKGRPVIAAAVLAILYGAIIDAQIYYCHGNYYSMDYNLAIFTFPVLVLLTGKAFLDSAQRESRILNENTTLRVEGELLFENYRKLDRYIEDTKKIWHDIDKHYYMLDRMAAGGKYDELERYLKYMGHDMKEAKSSYLCDNRLINAILTDKIAEAESKDIQVSFTGNLPDNLHIRGNDLCSLFVNMLDNAIEACLKIPAGREKSIIIVLKMKKDFVYFNVTNSSLPVSRADDGRLATSKEDNGSHGYGIAIMRMIARKYGGAFKLIPSEGSFMVRAVLKNMPAEDAQS